ncbi:MAG TPA: endonuclease/exonuclease/phosphatase family protein [Casimicrobiaceae bacterium]
MVKWLASSVLLAVLCGCITLTVEPRAVVSVPGGNARVMTLNCEAVDRVLRAAGEGEAADALDRRPLRLLVWNIHKQGDAGWERDLSGFAAASDVMLLQETVLQPPLRDILDDSGLRWVMASSFLLGADDNGVLTATRIAPIATCTQRAVEPLIRIPKSAVISWLPITGTRTDTRTGSRETLAIANVHSINFELALDAYRSQLEALADALADHRGPIIFAGDFNTWNDARDGVVAEIAARLGLTELNLRVDQRAVFFGRHLDHIFIRGLQLIDVGAIPVTSSDHNPLAATLRIP